MKTNQLERYGTAIFVIGSILGTYFFSRPRQGAFNTRLAKEQQEELDMNLTTPANATFGVVWPVIYTGTIGLAIHQALPSQQNNLRYQQARPLLWLNYGLNALFGYFFSKPTRSSRTGAGLTTISMLPAALALHRQLEIGRAQVSEPEKTFHKAIGIYAGWLTAASVVSAANLLQQAGYRPTPSTARNWAQIILSATGGLGIVVSKRLNDPYYLTPLIAAFVGIAAKQKGKNDSVALVAGTWALVLAGVFTQRLQQAVKAPATNEVVLADQLETVPADTIVNTVEPVS